MVDAIRRIDEIDPEECRRVARERFSAARMARDYMALYDRIRSREIAIPPVPEMPVPQPSK
jgi:hypothetical protein